MATGMCGQGIKDRDAGTGMWEQECGDRVVGTEMLRPGYWDRDA